MLFLHFYKNKVYGEYIGYGNQKPSETIISEATGLTMMQAMRCLVNSWSKGCSNWWKASLHMSYHGVPSPASHVSMRTNNEQDTIITIIIIVIAIIKLSFTPLPMLNKVNIRMAKDSSFIQYGDRKC